MISSPQPVPLARLLLSILVIVAPSAIAFLYVAPGVRSFQRLQRHQQAQTQYGTAAIARCANVKTNADTPIRGAWPARLRTVAIDSSDLTVDTTYDPAIPVQWHAIDSADLNAVLCIIEAKNLFDTGVYDSGEQCHRYTQDIAAVLVDVATGNVVGTKDFVGTDPPPCPDFTNIVGDETGQLVDPTAVTHWLTQESQATFN